MREVFDRKEAEPWRSTLLLTDKGAPKPSLYNVIEVLENHPEWSELFALDEFSNQIQLQREPPYARGARMPAFKDADAIEVAAWFGRPDTLSLPISSRMAHEGIIAVAERHSFNPVRDWLDRLEWDGTPRLASLFVDHFGCERNEYTEAVARCMLISSVARIRDPGCKADNMVVLEGPQGAGKTSALSALFGYQWHAEAMDSPSHKDFYQSLVGRWCVEIGELAAFSRAEAGVIKRAITTQHDVYRPAYGRVSQSFPRQCIFVGTTNEDEWNKDSTGGRRYWPIRCGGDIDVPMLRELREQLFAEADILYQRGEHWWDVPADAAAEQQDDRYVRDAWEERIQDWLDRAPGMDDADYPFNMQFPATPINEAEIGTLMRWALRIEVGRQSRQDMTRVGHAMRRLRWKKHRVMRNGRRRYVYVRPGHMPDPERSDV